MTIYEGGLEEFAVGEVADKVQVGGEEVVVGEAGDGAPEHLFEDGDVVGEFAAEFLDKKEFDFDGAAVAVGVVDGGNAIADGGIDAEFFGEFAGEGLDGGFAGLDFAAREFPFEAHGLVGSALADEEFAIGEVATQDQGSNDAAQGLRGLCGSVIVEFANRFFHVSLQV
jgi:hypothetical protein